MKCKVFSGGQVCRTGIQIRFSFSFCQRRRLFPAICDGADEARHSCRDLRTLKELLLQESRAKFRIKRGQEAAIASTDNCNENEQKNNKKENFLC